MPSPQKRKTRGAGANQPTLAQAFERAKTTPTRESNVVSKIRHDTRNKEGTRVLYERFQQEVLDKFGVDRQPDDRQREKRHKTHQQQANQQGSNEKVELSGIHYLNLVCHYLNNQHHLHKDEVGRLVNTLRLAAHFKLNTVAIKALSVLQLWQSLFPRSACAQGQGSGPMMEVMDDWDPISTRYAVSMLSTDSETMTFFTLLDAVLGSVWSCVCERGSCLAQLLLLEFLVGLLTQDVQERMKWVAAAEQAGKDKAARVAVMKASFVHRLLEYSSKIGISSRQSMLTTIVKLMVGEEDEAGGSTLGVDALAAESCQAARLASTLLTCLLDVFGLLEDLGTYTLRGTAQTSSNNPSRLELDNFMIEMIPKGSKLDPQMERLMVVLIRELRPRDAIRFIGMLIAKFAPTGGGALSQSKMISDFGGIARARDQLTSTSLDVDRYFEIDSLEVMRYLDDQQVYARRVLGGTDGVMLLATALVRLSSRDITTRQVPGGRKMKEALREILSTLGKTIIDRCNGPSALSVQSYAALAAVQLTCA